jgi:hypothetical protein
MRILTDTAFLLNEFFHRHPEEATRRGGPAPTPALLALWEQTHQALELLASMPVVFVCVAEYSVLRMASVLSDLQIDSPKVLAELEYCNSNFHMLSLSPGEAQQALETGLALHPTPSRQAEDYILAHLARRSEIDVILSPVPRPDGALGGVQFMAPAAFLEEHNFTSEPNS